MEAPSLEVLRATLVIARANRWPPAEISELERAIKEKSNGHGEHQLPDPMGGHEFLNQVDVEPEWIVPGLIPEKSLGMLAGPPGSAKTFAAIRAAADATQATHQVLLVEEECSGWDMRRRLRAAGADPMFFSVLHQKGVRIDAPEWVEHLQRHLEGVALCILDPLSNLHGLDDREQDAMVALWAILANLQRSSGAAIMVVHHTVKTSWVGDVPQLADIRGSSIIAGRLDWAYVLKPLVTTDKDEQPEEELQAVQETTLFEQHCVKMRGWAAPKPRVAELHNVCINGSQDMVPTLLWKDTSPKQAKRKHRQSTLRVRVLEACRQYDCESANAIWKAMGTNRTETMATIAELRRTGELVQDETTRIFRPSKVVVGFTGTASTNTGTGTTEVEGVVPGTVPPRGGTRYPPTSESREESETVPVVSGTTCCLSKGCSQPQAGPGIPWCLEHWNEQKKRFTAKGDA